MESSSNSGLVRHGAKVQQMALHLTQKGLFPGWGNKVQRTARSKHLREVPHSEHLIFERLTRNIFSSFVYSSAGGASGKESTCNAGDTGSNPGSGRSPGGGHGNPLQYYYPENSIDRGS